jgi:hypothetical protein
VFDRSAVQIGPEALGTYLCGRAEQVVKELAFSWCWHQQAIFIFIS